MIKTILIGLGDREFSHTATRYGVALAKRHGAILTGVTFLDLSRVLYVGPVPIGGGESAKELREHRLKLCQEHIEEAIVDFETQCLVADVPHEVVRTKGEPLESMISLSRYHDLVICGLRNLFEHGVVDEPPDELAKLVGEGVRPILAVTPEYTEVHRVLIAYSGSTESAKTMKRFVQLRIWDEINIRIVSVGRDESASLKRLDEAAAYCRTHGIHPEIEHVQGVAKDELLEHARQWQADLIVMGNSARNYFLKRIFGETALHVVANADRPVFLCQ